jgi:polysaccharide deacetylase 2 family uncharacterized protein YibQ
MRRSRAFLILLILGLCLLAVRYAYNASVTREKIDTEPVEQSGQEGLEDEETLSPDIARPETSGDAVPVKSEDAGRPKTRSKDLAGLLAIVMDDCGGSIELAKKVKSLDLPITWAIIPNLRFSSDTASLLRESGTPFLIHVPMQAIPDPDGKAGDPKYYYIGTGMSDEAVREALLPILDSLPGAYGINNHRGSKATADRKLMDSVMTVLEERGLFFMDSRTARESVAYEAAADMGLVSAKNNRFLDNESDRAKISSQIENAISSAKKRRQIAICHLRPETVAALESLSKDEIAKRGVKLVTLPELMELEESTYE